MLKTFKQQAGSSLIEVLVAVLVLSIGMVGALKLQAEGVRQNADSRYVMVAGVQAQTALDGLSNFNQVGQPWNDARRSAWQAAVAAALPQGSGTVSCANRLCTVTIKWTAPGGRREEETATYVVQTGA